MYKESYLSIADCKALKNMFLKNYEARSFIDRIEKKTEKRIKADKKTSSYFHAFMTFNVLTDITAVICLIGYGLNLSFITAYSSMWIGVLVVEALICSLLFAAIGYISNKNKEIYETIHIDDVISLNDVLKSKKLDFVLMPCIISYKGKAVIERFILIKKELS